MKIYSEAVSYKKLPVLLTGSSGVIGRALKGHLHDVGYEDVTSVSGSDVDLRDFYATCDLVASIRPALIFHLAARVSGIMGNMSNRAIAYTDNILMNTHLIEAAAKVGTSKIIAMGTTAIYSDLISLPMKEEDLWLGAPHGSEAPYAHAKRAMLAQLEAYREHYGMDFVYCISTNLYGPHDRFDEKHGHVVPSLISKFHRAVQLGENVTVWGTGTPQRDFLYAHDAARALVLLAERGSGPVNVASGRPVSIRTLVELLAELSGYSREILWDTSKPDGQMNRDYNVFRLASLGFIPEYSLRCGLSETLSWYRKNHLVARR